jgi:quercetin dioxygenase-like cupin family protein
MGSEIVTQLKYPNDKIEESIKRLDSIEKLFISKKDVCIKQELSGTSINDIKIKNVYSDGDLSATVAIWKKAGKIYPSHCHTKGVEHIVCIRGKLKVEYEGIIRTLFPTVCMTIGMGIFHQVIALEDDTMAIAICIPPEPAYLTQEESPWQK